ncbi:MAG TPA: PHP domain-containing protein, partial [Thauera sp.]|nr:PHP domain-containing protein [Thauera sp.]
MQLPAYAELHCLSNFSFLRGASHPDELVAQAAAQGYAALALTDECSLAGVVRAHRAAQTLRQQSIETYGEAVGVQKALKFLIGSEMTTVDGLKLVFLAKNREGYGNLSALITLARRRAEKGAYTLQRHDLNIVSPNGALPDCLVLWVPDETPSVADGRWLAERFPGRTWLAVELHAGVCAAPRRIGDLVPQLAGLQRLDRLVGNASDQIPVLIFLDGFEEGIGDAHRIVGVLARNGEIGFRIPVGV